MIRIAGTVAALLALLLVTASAQAATPPPVNDAVQSLVTKQRSAKTRSGMGLPPYKAILGKRWKKKVKRADAKLVSKLAPAVRTSVTTDEGAKAAGDVIRTGKERQRRRLKMAVALGSMCPRFADDPALAATIAVTGRAEQVVATVERVRGYEITTIVTLETKIEATSTIDDTAVLNNPTVGWGEFSVVRQQTARNLETGKLRETGPTQRMSGSLDPFFNVDSSFDGFINRNADGDDESPAPRRAQRTKAWDQVAQSFVSMLGAAMYADLKKAEKHFQTPNVCMTLDVPAPTHLSPGQKIDLTGNLRARGQNPTPTQILRSTRISGYLENEQGQTARSPASYPLDPGEVWYEFTAPKKKWPNSRPIGIEIVATSEGGVATRKVYFKARELPLPPKFSVTMAVQGTSSTSGEYREMNATATYTLQSANPGPDGSLNAWYDVEVSNVSHALSALGNRAMCHYEAPGAGGTLESGDLELRILPDGQIVYAFMLKHDIPSTYVGTDCPPDATPPPIATEIPAHLDTRRPGPAGQSLRPLPAGFTHQVSGATNVKSALLDASSATWTLTPQW
jgi:hypothetical protein